MRYMINQFLRCLRTKAFPNPIYRSQFCLFKCTENKKQQGREDQGAFSMFNPSVNDGIPLI